MDKKFIFAMVDCGELPCTISNVARNMNKTVKSISPTRAQLINKGLIYAVRHSEMCIRDRSPIGRVKMCPGRWAQA